MNQQFGEFDLYVAVDGNDTWSGRLATANPEKTDGPLASVTQARDLIRLRKKSGAFAGAMTVWIRGGRYPMTEPIVFGPQDSAPVTYCAYPGEQPIFDGGTPIKDWRLEKQGQRNLLLADVPEAAAGKWSMRQLWVNGQRRMRPRVPKVTPQERDFFFMESVPGVSLDTKETFMGDISGNAFISAAGDFKNWRYVSEIDVVALHFWVEERMPVVSFEPHSRLVTSSRRSYFLLRDDWNKRFAKYYIENVFEALSEPGEWFWQRDAGKLHYIPMPGESADAITAVAPRIRQFIRIVGDPDAGKYVEFLRFSGLTFEHSEWDQPRGGSDPLAGGVAGVDYATAPQAAFNVPGVIYLEGARFCSVEDCAIRHIGWYGIELADGCMGNRLIGNEISDMGAGGIKINGADAAGPHARRTGNNLISDNHIHTGGRVFHSAVGILSRHSFGNTLAHNHIHDLYYSGICAGWVWGYADNVSKDNCIEKNHIHDLGHGWLSDMAGIYTLGVQPGTVIRGNLIHDVERGNYGGWAIYPDEGSSHLIIENNICHSTTDQPFHQHYGRENILRNNIFAFGKEAQVAISRPEPHNSVTLEKNIIVTQGDKPVFHSGATLVTYVKLRSDLNLIWSTDGEPVPAKDISLKTWREEHKHDVHSLIADPRFKDLQHFDFALAQDSPALKLGFEPIDMTDVGPRPKHLRL